MNLHPFVLGACALLLHGFSLFSALAETNSPSPAQGTFEGLFYETTGQGPAIILLHDGLLHREGWQAQWNPFSTGHRVVRYDRRGYGQSKAADRTYSHVGDLLALMRHLQITNAALVGSSAGGKLAIDFALDHPEMVNKLVLVGPIVGGLAFSPHFEQRNRLAFQPLTERQDVSATISNWVNDRWLISPTNSKARARLADLLAANPQNLTRSSRHETKTGPAALGRLAKLSVPTLIVVGENDIPDVHAHAGAIAAGIPGARRIVMSGAGHLPYLEQPAEFNQVVLDFLATPATPATVEPQTIPERRNTIALDGGAVVPVREGMVNGLFYEVAGSGPPLVFIHGGQMDRRIWDDQLAHFHTNAQVLRYDLRGYGKSVAPTKPFSHTDDLSALLKHVRMEQPVLVGLSLGGRVALDYCLATSNAVTALFLASPGLGGFRPAAADDSSVALGQVNKAAADGLDEQAANLWLAHPFMRPAMEHPELRTRLGLYVRDNIPSWRIDGSLEQKLVPRAATRLSEIGVPTLLLLGGRDVPVMAEIAALIETEIPGVRLQTVPNAGHILSMEAPLEFNEALRAFLVEAYTPTTYAEDHQPPGAAHLFSYDATAPLQLEERARWEREGVYLSEITYQSPRGGRVPAYLITPLHAGAGTNAGVVFMHPAGRADRSYFLHDALALGRQGTVSITITAPFGRPGGPPLFQYDARDRESWAQGIVDLRRAVDVLSSLPEVDTNRIAYVGFSYGATLGGVLAGIEKRFRAFVLMGGGPQITSYLRKLKDPAAENAKRQGRFEEYLQLMTIFDPENYIAHAAPAALLFQNGSRDNGGRQDRVKDYVAQASEPKTLRWYDTGHELDETARRERHEWLRQQLNLPAAPPPVRARRPR